MFAFLLSSFLITPPRAARFDHGYAKWNAVLKDASRDGRVDYRKLKTLGDLEPILSSFAAVKEEDLNSWSKPQRMAFWINAYNAFVVKAVLRSYPIPPRRKCEYPGGSGAPKFDPWGCPSNSVGRIADMWNDRAYDVAGRKFSLDEIQNDVMRRFADVRVLFALSKGSLGCPSLRGEAYTPERLLSQLDGDVRRFFESRSCWDVNVDDRRLKVSPVLQWYHDWFDSYDDGSWEGYPRAARGPVSYLAQLIPEYEYAPMKARPLDFEWMKYDWNLNDLPLLQRP